MREIKRGNLATNPFVFKRGEIFKNSRIPKKYYISRTKFNQNILKMKKILVVAILLIGYISASAQNFGIGGGFVNSTTNIGNTSSAFNGGYVQATADLNLSNAFSVVAGLRYMYTAANKGISLPFFGKTVSQAVGVPVFAKMNVINTGDMKAFLFAGPTLYYGLAFKSQSGELIANWYENETFKPLNVTVGGGIGLDVMEAVRFTIGYDYGVTNRLSTTSSKSNTGDIRLGVTFLL